MSQVDDNTVNKTTNRFITAFLTTIGTSCILQFIVIGLINVIRGYSIGTRLPHTILLVGLVIFIRNEPEATATKHPPGVQDRCSYIEFHRDRQPIARYPGCHQPPDQGAGIFP